MILWTWSAEELGKLVGVVTSGARASVVPIRVTRELIDEVHDEMLVVIEDFVEGRRYLGAIKSSVKLDIAIDGIALPTTFDPEKSKQYSAPMMRTYVEIFGEIKPEGGLELSFAIPRPGSHVYLVQNGKAIAKILRLPQGLVVGHHKFSGLELHIDPKAIDYHIAVLGATGTGKSRLVKALIEEILAKTRYSVVVFDHTGVDYADLSRWQGIDVEIVDASKVILDPIVISEMLIDRMGLTGYHEENMYYAVLRYIIEEIVQNNPSIIEKLGIDQKRMKYSGLQLSDIDIDIVVEEYVSQCRQQKFKWDYTAFSRAIQKYLTELGSRNTTLTKYLLLLSLRVGKSFFNSYLAQRYIAIDDIVAKLLAGEKRLIIVDLSTEVEYEAKRFVVSQFLKKVWEYISVTRSRANLVAVIDEAHNYACNHCKPANQEIARTAREGRKWGFGLILASQRIIDLSTEVRGNLNTIFFSRLQTHSDYQELRNWIEGVQYMEYTLPMLTTREFFVSGLGNPLRKPILLKVREVV